MRKFTLLLALMAFIGSSFAQQAKLAPMKNTSIEKATQVKATKSKGDVIWSTDFNKEDWISTVDPDGDKGGFLSNGSVLPDKWSTIDLTVEGNNRSIWHWTDVGARGIYTNSPEEWDVPEPSNVDPASWPAGASVANGVMVLESDWFNTTDLGEKPVESIVLQSYLMYGPIDLSEANGVLISFNTLFRFCCAGDHGFNLEVSNDYDPSGDGGSWTAYDIRKGTGGNDLPFREHRFQEFNVGTVAANQESVYIRFSTSNATDYFCMIDDLAITVPPDNDLIITRGWADYTSVSTDDDEDVFNGGFAAIPVDAAGTFDQFRANVLNNGLNKGVDVKLNTIIYKDGIEVDKISSLAKDINSGMTELLTLPSTFSPDEIGSYQVSMTVKADGIEDDVPGNNGWSYEFETTENTYSRVRHGMESSFADVAAAQWTWSDVAPMDGDVMVVQYFIDEGTKVMFSGVNVFIDNTDDADELAAIANGQYQMKARAYKYDEESEDIVSLNLASELITLKTNELGTWVYLPYVDEGELMQEEGEYYIGFEFYTGTSGTDMLWFRIGNDNAGIPQPIWNNMVFLNGSGKWGGTGNNQNFAIDLMVNYTPPTMVDLTFNYDMQYETLEAGDVVNVRGDFMGDSIALTYNATTKMYTGVVSYESSTTVTDITYLAYINDDVELDVAREISISNADVTVNHTYAWKTSVTQSELNLVNVYPNPFSNTLTLTNLNNVSNIIVSNVLGQTIMTVNDIENTVEISTSSLENGVYLITIVDANNNMRTERVIKN